MAKPKLALIPSAQGSKFYSVLPSSGVGDFTFSRSGSATRINSQGLIETVSSGESRLNYPLIDGKVVGCPHHILEPQSTNLETKSNEFSTWGTNSNITRTANYIVSPDGTVNGTRLQFTANGFCANTTQVHSSYTISCYAKRNDSGTQNVGFFTNGSGVVNSAWEITSEWKRFTYTYNTANASFVGISGNSGADISVYGFQLEQGSYPTSYIPTNGSAVTRSAETAYGSGDADTFNDSEGVLMAEISALADDGTYRILSLSDGTTDERVYMQYTNVSNTLAIVVKNGAVTQANISYILPNETEFSKVLFKYKSNDFALWVNGFEVGTDTSGNTPIGLSELAFDDGNGGNDFYGNTKQLQYYDTALTDSELEQLTSWVSFSDMAEGQQYSIQ